MLSLLLAAATAAAAPRVAAVEHTATHQGDRLAWQTRIVVVEPDAEPLTVALVHPVDGLAEVRVPARARSWTFATSQPLVQGEADALHPPLLQVELPQRIDLDGVRWDPDPALGLEHRLRHVVPAGMTPRERREVDRQLDGRPVPRGSRIYVRADAPVVAAGGLPGPVASASQVPVAVAAGVGGLFLVVLAGGALGYRHLEVQARRERLDAYINDEFVRRELEGAGSS